MADAPGRALGLDLGAARIGVAISDERRRVAVPYGTVPAGAPQDLKAVVALVAEHGVAVVVVGYPIGLSGEPGAAARAAETFAGALRQVLGVPVELHDERLTTVEAERGLRAAGARGAARRRAVDASAATIMLQAYLDGSRPGEPPPADRD